MRILYVIKKLEYGGAEFQLLAIADRQRNLGHAIKIITLNMPEPYFLDKVKQLLSSKTFILGTACASYI